MSDEAMKQMHTARLREALAYFKPEDVWALASREQALALLKYAPMVAGPREALVRGSSNSLRFGCHVAEVTLGVASNHERVGAADRALTDAGWLLVDNVAEEARTT